MENKMHSYQVSDLNCIYTFMRSVELLKFQLLVENEAVLFHAALIKSKTLLLT